MPLVRIVEHSNLAIAGHRPPMVVCVAIPRALPFLRPPVSGKYLQRPETAGRGQGTAQREAPQSIDLRMKAE
jgi:hypothetical protein